MEYLVPGILHARILEWVALPFSRYLPNQGIAPQVSHIAGRVFTSWATKEATREALCLEVKKIKLAMYSLNGLPSQIGTSLLFHVQF